MFIAKSEKRHLQTQFPPGFRVCQATGTAPTQGRMKACQARISRIFQVSIRFALINSGSQNNRSESSITSRWNIPLWSVNVDGVKNKQNPQTVQPQGRNCETSSTNLEGNSFSLQDGNKNMAHGCYHSTILYLSQVGWKIKNCKSKLPIKLWANINIESCLWKKNEENPMEFSCVTIQPVQPVEVEHSPSLSSTLLQPEK